MVATPGELRGSPWRRERLNRACYALGWRVFDYAGHTLVFHGGAVQGYRGLVALLPERDLGIVVLWNSESSVPSGLLPTILDRAIGLSDRAWLDIEFDDPSLFVNGATPGTRNQNPNDAGTTTTKATASPQVIIRASASGSGRAA